MEQKKHPEKDYRKRSGQFFLIGLIVALGSSLVAFEWATFEENVIRIPEPIGPVFVEDEPPIRLTERKAPKLPEPVKLAPQPDPDPDPTPGPEPDPDPNPDPEPIIDTAGFNSGFEPEPTVSDNLPIKIAEQMPEFRGGINAMYKYLGKNLNYPKYAREINEEAKVYVQFIVNKDGSISDVESLKKVGYGFDEEAIRVVKSMPKWKPGKQGGKKVRVIYVLPINFTLKR